MYKLWTLWLPTAAVVLAMIGFVHPSTHHLWKLSALLCLAFAALCSLVADRYYWK